MRRPFENLLASIYPASCHRKVLRSMRTMPPKMVDMIAMATYPIPRELTRESLTEIFCLMAMDVFLGGTRIVSMIFSILSVRLPVCALCLLLSHVSPSGNQYLIYYWDMTSFHKDALKHSQTPLWPGRRMGFICITFLFQIDQLYHWSTTTDQRTHCHVLGFINNTYYEQKPNTKNKKYSLNLT